MPGHLRWGRFFFKGKIGDQPFTSNTIKIGSGAQIIVKIDVNQEFQVAVELSPNIPIHLEQWESGEGEFGGDAFCQEIDVILNPATCQVSGDLSGTCDTPLQFDDFSEHWLFTISVPHLNLRCLHYPIWPLKPGELVEIRAEVLDQNGNPITSPVDNIEIFADDMVTPIKTSVGGPSVLQASHAPAGGPEGLVYRCRANHNLAPMLTSGTEFVSSGQRRVQIGQPEEGRAVKILNTGPSNSKVDIFFIVDPTAKDAFNNLLYPKGAMDPAFLDDVHTVIRDAYYAGNATLRTTGLLFLGNQDMLNFWIALDPAKATPRLPPECPDIDEPNGWDSDYIFADLGVIIHPVPTFARSCAFPSQRLTGVFPIGTIANGIRTLLHETGHVPFGLSDEYCCDGSYLEHPFNLPSEIPHLDNFPNVYRNVSPDHPNPRDRCLEDPLAVAGSCDLITGRAFRLDSASTIGDDIMVGGNSPQAADKRRINLFFNICRQFDTGRC